MTNTGTPLNVLVTGATSGIGLATALHLSRIGHRVIGSARTPERATPLLEQSAKAGVPIDWVQLDVTNAASCAQAMEQVQHRFDGQLSALINNAGTAFGGALQDCSDAMARTQFEVNVLGPLRLARLALPAMRVNRTGRIINVSSFLSRVPAPFLGLYSASKRALDAATDALRLESAHFGIQIISIQPGVFDSEIWDRESADIQRFQDSWYAASYARIQPKLPSARRGPSPQLVALAVARALESAHPRRRYLVGADARLAVAAETVLPGFLLDFVKRWTVGLTTRRGDAHASRRS